MEQKSLSERIIFDINKKTNRDHKEVEISVERHINLQKEVMVYIEKIKSDEQSKELKKIKKDKTFLEHKEKFNNHFSKFENYVNNQVWIKKAKEANYMKRKIIMSPCS